MYLVFSTWRPTLHPSKVEHHLDISPQRAQATTSHPGAGHHAIWFVADLFCHLLSTLLVAPTHCSRFSRRTRPYVYVVSHHLFSIYVSTALRESSMTASLTFVSRPCAPSSPFVSLHLPSPAYSRPRNLALISILLDLQASVLWLARACPSLPNSTFSRPCPPLPPLRAYSDEFTTYPLSHTSTSLFDRGQHHRILGSSIHATSELLPAPETL